MNKQHTPGPWEYAFGTDTTALIVGADGSTVTHICTIVNTTAHKNIAANVRLIVAAPELLEALERIAASDHTHTHFATLAISEARAAIAKATGESA